jgi:hypothetical protein
MNRMLQSLRFGCERFTSTTGDEGGESSQAPPHHVRSAGMFFLFLREHYLILTDSLSHWRALGTPRPELPP